MVNLEFVTGKNLLQGIHSELRICYKEAPAVNLNNTWGARIKCLHQSYRSNYFLGIK